MPSVLDGIRVLDFSRVFAGPAATQILGDLGADVIKVEDPGGGDDARYYGIDENKAERLSASPPFLALNRNKRSIGIDLRQPAGSELAARLARASDVLLHNFRPGVMARWGLDYPDVEATNPSIIYCDFSAYGQSGPRAHIGANDVALQAHSGLMSITGSPGGEPVRSGTSVVDLHGGLAMASAVLAALYHRERTGEGQRVGSSLLLSSAHLMGYFYTEYWLDGTVRRPMGSANHLTVPNQAFPTSDGSVVIIASTDDMWRRCAHALDARTLDVPAFATAEDRRLHRKELVAAVSAITSQRTGVELVEVLGRSRVVVSKVNSTGEAADDPQLAAIGAVTGFVFEDTPVKAVTMPFTMSRTPGVVKRPPPRVAEHTEQILKECGLRADEIRAFAERGAFGAALDTEGAT